MKDKNKEFPRANGLARTIPKPPSQPVSETKDKPTSDSSKKKS